MSATAQNILGPDCSQNPVYNGSGRDGVIPHVERRSMIGGAGLEPNVAWVAASPIERRLAVSVQLDVK